MAKLPTGPILWSPPPVDWCVCCRTTRGHRSPPQVADTCPSLTSVSDVRHVRPELCRDPVTPFVGACRGYVHTITKKAGVKHIFDNLASLHAFPFRATTTVPRPRTPTLTPAFFLRCNNMRLVRASQS